MGSINQGHENKVVVICGMHRSYTSLFSHWLSVCGLNLGQRFAPASNDNPSGYFEDLDFLEFHESILVENNLHSTDSSTFKIDITDSIKARASQLLAGKSVDERDWGWKDPRNSLLYKPLWSHLIKNPKLIILFRHYTDVIKSMCVRRKRQNISNIKSKTFVHGKNIFARLLNYTYKFGLQIVHRKPLMSMANHDLKLWITYNQELLKLAQNAPANDVLVLSSKQLLQFDAEIFEYIFDKWELDITYHSIGEFWQPSKSKNIKLKKLNPDLVAEADFIFNELTKVQFHGQ